MQQPCLELATVKVHPVATTEQAQPALLSLGFQCPETERRVRREKARWWYPKTVRKNYHVLLFSLLVLTFFAVLEWTTPLPAHSLADQQPSLPAIAKQLLYGQL